MNYNYIKYTTYSKSKYRKKPNPLQACKIFQFCKKIPIFHPITINVYTAQVLHLLALSCKLNIRLILQLIVKN